MTENILKFQYSPKKFRVWVNWVKSLGVWQCVSTSAGAELAIKLDGSAGVTLDGMSDRLSESAKAYILRTPESDIAITQFTGLKDKNGTEIFEGDIISGRGEIYKVCWSDEVAGWRAIGNDWDDLYNIVHEVEVIGNIFENPELIKVE